MPFVLITAGVVLFLTAINGTYQAFFSQLYQDMFGGSSSGNNSTGFIYWALALVIVGLIGYIPEAKKPADFFMALVILGMILANGGFFTQLQQAIQAGPSTPASANPLQAVPIAGSPSWLSSAIPAVTSVIGGH